MDIAGKAALVTGGGQGLGKAFAKILLQKGAKVLFTDVNQAVSQGTLKEFQTQFGQNNVVFIKADVTSEVQMNEAFQLAKSSFGRLDILVNNAGIGGEGPDMWEKLIDINLKGAIRCARLAVDHLSKTKGGNGGVIVNIASAGGLKPQPYGPVYAASKAGLIMYTRSLAANDDIRQNGIRVNVLCPAFADTALVQSIKEGSSTDNDQAWAFVQQIGIMTVDYVAEGMLELVIDETKNGAVLALSKLQGKAYVPF